MIVIQKGNHVYVHRPCLRASRRTVSSIKGSDSPHHQSLRQTSRDQRIKIEERSEGNWARDRALGFWSEEEEEEEEKIESVSLISESGFGFTDIGV